MSDRGKYRKSVFKYLIAGEKRHGRRRNQKLTPPLKCQNHNTFPVAWRALHFPEAKVLKCRKTEIFQFDRYGLHVEMFENSIQSLSRVVLVYKCLFYSRDFICVQSFEVE